MNAALLDTSAAIAFLRGRAPLGDVLAGLDRIVLTPVVAAELLAGAGDAGTKTRGRVHALLDGPRIEWVAITRETSVRYAAIKRSLQAAGTPVPTNDLWIAASAMEHGLTVLTLDRHFLTMPQILVEYFEAGKA